MELDECYGGCGMLVVCHTQLLHLVSFTFSGAIVVSVLPSLHISNNIPSFLSMGYILPLCPY